MRVLGDRILIRRTPNPWPTQSTLLLVEFDRKRSEYGQVVAVGTGRMSTKGVRIPSDLVVGDYVFAHGTSGADIEVGGETLAFVTEDDILATYTP